MYFEDDEVVPESYEISEAEGIDYSSSDHDGNFHAVITRLVMEYVKDITEDGGSFYAFNFNDWYFQIAQRIVQLGNNFIKMSRLSEQTLDIWEYLKKEGYDYEDQGIAYITTCVYMYVYELS